MEKMNVSIVFIDDDPNQARDAALDELEMVVDEIVKFQDSQKGLDYIKSHLEKRMIVLLDLGFSRKMLDGHKVLAGIREISDLVPVIIWSGKDIYPKDLADLFEHHAFSFISKDDDSEVIVDTVRKAYIVLQNDIRSVIEDWVSRQKPDSMDKPYMVSADGRSYSLNDILMSVRKQDDFGKEFVKNIMELATDLFLRRKRG